MKSINIDGVAFSLNMKALASLEDSFKVSGLEKIMGVVSDGGHTKMVTALAAMSSKQVDYFNEWSMKETQDVFMRAFNMSLYGSEEAPESEEESE